MPRQQDSFQRMLNGLFVGEAMDNLNFEWDDANIAHIGEHDVDPEEAEEIVLGDSMEMDFDVVNGEERWSYVGETGDGRLLRVLFTMRSDRIRVVTAFVPSPLQKRIFLRWKAERQKTNT